MHILPLTPISDAEQSYINECLSQPQIKKYLQFLAQTSLKDLATLGAMDMPDGSVAKRHSYISGQLAVLETLLSIQPQKQS